MAGAARLVAQLRNALVAQWEQWLWGRSCGWGSAAAAAGAAAHSCIRAVKGEGWLRCSVDWLPWPCRCCYCGGGSSGSCA